MIDTHAHLYSSKFDADRVDMVHRAKAAGLQRVYLPNIDLESVSGMLALEALFPDFCFPMIGLHPSSVSPDTYRSDLTGIERLLTERIWYGIGETGIDLYWDKTTLAIQKIAFSRHVEWAKDLGLPLIIHSREANREALDVVRAGQDGRLRGIFHCFSGTFDEALEMIDAGFVLGIGGTVTYPTSPLPEILTRIGLEHLVLETDAPYLSPVPYRGKRNESAYVAEVALRLSAIFGVDPGEVVAQTTANAIRMFEKAG
jgi:TatD DNase family protein